jgi:hypothetical protein
VQTRDDNDEGAKNSIELLARRREKLQGDFVEIWEIDQRALRRFSSLTSSYDE